MNRGKYKRGKFALFYERIDAIVDGKAKAVVDVEPRENTDGFGIEFYNVDERFIVVPEQSVVTVRSKKSWYIRQVEMAFRADQFRDRRINVDRTET